MSIEWLKENCKLILRQTTLMIKARNQVISF